MTDRPYTDADLRAEAARQHAELTEDPDYSDVGNGMWDEVVPSTGDGLGGSNWGRLLDQEADDNAAYSEAQRRIYGLITGAADVSEWAVNLGADNLQPTAHLIEIEGPDGGVAVRLHFAFDPDMPGGIRDEVVNDLVRAIAPVIPLRRQH